MSAIVQVTVKCDNCFRSTLAEVDLGELAQVVSPIGWHARADGFHACSDECRAAITGRRPAGSWTKRTAAPAGRWRT